SQRQWRPVCGDRVDALVALVGLVDSARHSAGANRSRSSGAKRVARAIPSGAEGRNDPAAGRELRRATAALRTLSSRVQRAAAARSVAGSAAGESLCPLAPIVAGAPAAARVSRPHGDPARVGGWPAVVAWPAAASDRGLGGATRRLPRSRPPGLAAVLRRDPSRAIRRTHANAYRGGSCARLKTRVWKLPELWTQRTRPQAPWKTHKTRFPQLPHASTKCHPCLRTNLSPMCPAVRT